ncbi:MAG: hypothetical protein HXX09_04690 [Bacteroidetes bacterium]|nr:hypothetical protein [Bacteroidota bacterium]
MDEKRPKPKYLELLQNVLRYFGFFMILIYVAFGLYIILSESFAADLLNKTQRISIGTLLIIYGIFRSYRTIKEIKK